jgi:hypothetical protein
MPQSALVSFKKKLKKKLKKKKIEKRVCSLERVPVHGCLGKTVFLSWDYFNS